MEKHQIEEQPFLIEVGDWICKEGKLGQVTQIYHDYYEEYSDFTAWNAGGGDSTFNLPFNRISKIAQYYL